MLITVRIIMMTYRRWKESCIHHVRVSNRIKKIYLKLNSMIEYFHLRVHTLRKIENNLKIWFNEYFRSTLTTIRPKVASITWSKSASASNSGSRTPCSSEYVRMLDTAFSRNVLNRCACSSKNSLPAETRRRLWTYFVTTECIGKHIGNQSSFSGDHTRWVNLNKVYSLHPGRQAMVIKSFCRRWATSGWVMGPFPSSGISAENRFPVRELPFNPSTRPQLAKFQFLPI